MTNYTAVMLCGDSSGMQFDTEDEVVAFFREGALAATKYTYLFQFADGWHENDLLRRRLMMRIPHESW